MLGQSRTDAAFEAGAPIMSESDGGAIDGGAPPEPAPAPGAASTTGAGSTTERAKGPGRRLTITLAQVAVPLGMALIVGVFAYLGVEGDLLTRLLRNDPRLVTAAFITAVAGAAIPVLVGGLSWAARGRAPSAGWDSATRWGEFVGGLVVLGAAGVAVVAAVQGAGERERPTLTITEVRYLAGSTAAPQGAASGGGRVEATSGDVVELTVTSLGRSLASADALFLRVSGYPEGAPVGEMWRDCSSIPLRSGVPGDETLFFPALLGGSVLYAGESGPDALGSASKSITVHASLDDYRYVCAVAVLSISSDDGRFATMILDLESAGPARAAVASTPDP